MLDEAANVAPLGNLDSLASTAASHGIQLLTVFQDIAQIEARYGRRAATIVNNHRAKLVLSGIADSATLEQPSGLIGDGAASVRSTTFDGGRTTTTEAVEHRRLAPPDWLRRIRPGDAVLIYGPLPPCRLGLRLYYADRALARLARGGSAERFTPSAPRSSARRRRAWLRALRPLPSRARVRGSVAAGGGRR